MQHLVLIYQENVHLLKVLMLAVMEYVSVRLLWMSVVYVMEAMNVLI